MYDFATHVDRKGTGSEKWEGMYKICPDVPDGIVPLSVADMEFKNAPEIAQALARFAENTVLGYTMPTSEYHESVVGWMRRRHDWDVPTEWIATSPGVVPALFHMVKMYTQPGDGIIIMPPVYYPFRLSIECTGRTMVENPLILADDHYEIDFDDLEAKAADPANKMLIFCSPHNPVGRVWSAEELKRVVDICCAHDVLIACDEIHNDLIMPGNKHTVIAKVATPEQIDKIIVCTAPSKTFNLAGLQCSNIFIANEELRGQFVRGFWKENGLGDLNAFAYPVCREVYDHCAPWLDELLQVLEGNRKFMCDFIASELPQVKTFPLQGTYLQWADFRALGMDEKQLEKFMQEKAYLFLDEGYVFGEQGKGFERFNIACPQDVLQSSLERLATAVRALI